MEWAEIAIRDILMYMDCAADVLVWEGLGLTMSSLAGGSHQFLPSLYTADTVVTTEE